ncbi:MAG TPA: hypothetical protein VFF05_10675, partial [Rudaea sp.]|nr:hypothetical protein [Rudaea sp.]
MLNAYPAFFNLLTLIRYYRGLPLQKRTVPMRFPTLSRLGLMLFAVLLASCHRGEPKKDAAEYLP